MSWAIIPASAAALTDSPVYLVSANQMLSFNPWDFEP
jgi:hypothetical protein